MMLNFLACPYPDLAPIFSLIKYVISIVAVVIPIILIVLGIIDFSKAVMAKDEGEIKKNQGIFIKRVIYAVAIFFVYTIVVFVMNLVTEYIDEDANSWLECFNEKYVDGNVGSNYDRALNYCKSYEGAEKERCVSCYVDNNLNAVYRNGKCDTTIAVE